MTKEHEHTFFAFFGAKEEISKKFTHLDVNQFNKIKN